MPPPFPTCGLTLPVASPPTPKPRRCACKAACDAASRCSRSDSCQPKKPGNCDQAHCTTAQTNRPMTWAGFRPHDYAKARRPDTHDAIHWIYSKESHSFGSSLGVLPTPPRRFTLSPYKQGFAAWGKGKPAARSGVKGGSWKSFAQQTQRAGFSPSFPGTLDGETPTVECSPIGESLDASESRMF